MHGNAVEHGEAGAKSYSKAGMALNGPRIFAHSLQLCFHITQAGRCYDIPLSKGLVGSWLTPDLYREGGAPGYKSVGRSHIRDRIIIKYNQFTLMFLCSACKS
jgi:hypothetical protein